jgi:hypothetical protein
MVIVPHPPYSPNLVRCDFALFPKLKMNLKARHFEAAYVILDGIKENNFHGASEA